MAALTRMHFKAAANIIKGDMDVDGASTWLDKDRVEAARFAARAFSDLFRQFNPQFDEHRFMVACGLTKE